MKMKLSLGVAALLLSASSVLALTTQEVVDGFSAQGYTRIEVKSGPTQMKVEAIRGTQKVEVVYDAATGAVLKSETEAVGPGDDTAPGIEIKTLGRDFLDGDDLDDDGDDGDDDDGDDDDGDDDDDNGADDDDDDDDDSGRGRGRGRGGDSDED